EMYKLSFLNKGNLILRFLIFVVVISLVCTLSTFPLVAYYFGQVPLLSLFSNVFATLLAYGIMFFSVLFWLFSFWHGAQTLIASILNLLAKGMETLTSFISSIPHSTLSFRPTILEVILLYVAIVSLFLYIKKRTARPIIVLLATIIFFSISRIVGNLFTLS
ncbi:MAG: ComEC/Rec2 family competence protein, partial [Bacteroidaceae bacterium]|nr:ComEC/Rec2 family competence protein [Bacteroidaceae bacterium]